MKKLIRTLALMLCALLLLSGCNLIEKNAERDGDQVVAEISTEKIYKSEYTDALESTLANYGLTVEDLDSEDYASIADTFREQVLQMLVDQKVELVKARELGLTDLTDDEKAEIQAEVDELIEDWREYYRDSISTDSPGLTDEELEEEIDVQVKNMREESGYTDDYIWNVYYEQYIGDKLMEEETKDIVATEDEISEAYDEAVTAAREDYEEEPTYFDYDMMYGSTIYYYPEECRRVKHILIGFDDDTVSAITACRSSEEDTADTDADAIREAAAEQIQDDVDAVMAKIGDGSDGEVFDAVMKEESTDTTGIENYPDGFIIFASTSMYMTEFRDAGMSIAEVGGIATAVTDYGVHIVRLEEVIPAGAVALEDVYETVKATADEDKKYDSFTAMVEEWSEQYNVKTYTDRLK